MRLRSPVFLQYLSYYLFSPKSSWHWRLHVNTSVISPTWFFLAPHSVNQELNIVHFTCCKWNLFIYVKQYSFHYMLVCFGCSGEHTGTLSHCPCGAAVLLSRSRSHAGYCICVLCVTSCVRLWIVSGTMARFALKGHLNHLPLRCKRRGIQLPLPPRQYVFILLRCHLNAVP